MHFVPPMHAPLALLEWTGLAAEVDILGSAVTSFDLRFRQISLSRSTLQGTRSDRGKFFENAVRTVNVILAEHCVCCPLHSAAHFHGTLSTRV